MHSRFNTAFRRWLLPLTLLNTVISMLVTLLYVPSAAYVHDLWGGLFLFSALFGQFLIGLLLVSAPAMLLGRIQRLRPLAVISLWVLQAMFLLLVLVDAQVYRLFNFHINGMVVNLVFGGALQENLSFSPLMWALVAGLILLCLVGGTVIGYLVWKHHDRFPKHLHGRSIVAAAILVFLFGHVSYAFFDAIGFVPVTINARYVPEAKPLTARVLLHRFGIGSGHQAQEKWVVPADSRLRYPRAQPSCHADSRPNIIILAVDALRADMLTPEVMPRAWGFAQHAMVFDHHISTGNATRYGLFGMLYGLPGGYWQAMLQEERGSVFVDELVKQGYGLYLYGSAPLTSPEFDRTAFSAVRDRLQQGTQGMSIVEKDRDVTERLIQSIDRHDRDRPFFALLFLDSPHGYAIPDALVGHFKPMLETVNYLTLSNDTDPVPFMNRYKTSVFYTDSLIGRVLDELQAQALLDNSIVIITSDHGQEFNELHRNTWGHNSDFSRYETQVPMVIHWPGMAAQHVGLTSSHEDLVPTLMTHALGCSTPIADYSTGEDLFALPSGHRSLMVESWSKRALVTDDTIAEFNSAGIPTLYDSEYHEKAGASRIEGLAQALEKLSRFK